MSFYSSTCLGQPITFTLKSDPHHLLSLTDTSPGEKAEIIYLPEVKKERTCTVTVPSPL